MSAIQRWNDRVETHHAQSLAAQAGFEQPEDFWRPFASHFRADPQRTDDAVLNRLAREVSPTKSLLDVGGGAGRFALPLALRCSHVTLVDPSGSMLEEFRNGAREAAIENVSAVEGSWEDAEIGPADVVLCAHVVYGVADVKPFIRKLAARAAERALVLMFTDSPQSALSPFWQPVHGEERVDLPAMPELLWVLWEMGIFPAVEIVETGAAQQFESREAAIDQLRQRLYVMPDTPKDERLHAAAEQLLAETVDGLVIPGAPRRRQGLLSWNASG